MEYFCTIKILLPLDWSYTKNWPMSTTAVPTTSEKDISLTPVPTADPESQEPLPTTSEQRDDKGRIIYATTNNRGGESSGENQPRRRPRKFDIIHRLFCDSCFAKYYVGNMPVLLGREGRPILIMGVWWP